jgi:hypothetical protein
MPIEIRELIIRAEMDDRSEPDPAENREEGQRRAFDRQAIIEECVQRALAILEKEKER